MHPFTFTRAGSNDEVISTLQRNGRAKIIAGGTNIVDLMKLHIEKPDEIIDISNLGYDKVEELPDGSIKIGSLVRNSDLAYHPLIIERYPVLSEALLAGASAQLRNMATVGGNLLQRTRCPYFYDNAFACNKRQPGAGCDAIRGYNRSNAILGGSDQCIATHPSDMCVALAALDAQIYVHGPQGERMIPITSFHVVPGNTPNIETTLKHNELITSVVIAPMPYARRSHYLKVRDRASYDFALASAAVALDISNGRIAEARIALGGVGTKPWRSPAAESVLSGAVANNATYEKAADAAVADAKTREHNSFKVKLAKRTLIRTLEIVENMS